MMYVNTFPIPIVTKCILPKIIKREKRGAVITVSSVAAEEIIYQGLSVYSGTKAFDQRFSEIL